MPAWSIAVVSEFCGSCNSAASIRASAVPSSSRHAVCSNSQTCLEPLVLVSARLSRQLTPEFLSPFSQLRFIQRCIEGQSLFDAFAHNLVLVHNFNLRVLEVCDSQSGVAAARCWFSPASGIAALSVPPSLGGARLLIALAGLVNSPDVVVVLI